MKLKHTLFAAAMMLTGTQAWADGGFSDTSIGVRNAWNVANVGGAPNTSPRGVDKLVVNVSHFDVWDYGTNFFNVDFLFSDKNEPANNSSAGSTEVYGVYRAQLSPDKIFGINTKFGPVSAINFEIGGDANAENTAFAPAKKLIVVGPNVHFDLGAGFLNVGIHFAHEWNYNGFSSCPSHCGKAGPVSFDPTAEFEFVWSYSLKDIVHAPLTFSGFMNVVLPKGKDGFGNHTYTEVLAVPKLSLDIGSMMFGKPHKPDIYAAVELWEHKFGANTRTAGSEQVAPTIGIEVHF